MIPSAQALTDYMSKLSEQAYSAGWMQGLEFALWRAVREGPRRYGHLDITTDHISKLKTLSEACGSWIVFNDGTGETPIGLDEWQKIYADQITSMKSVPLQPITTKQFIGCTVLVTMAFAFLVINQGRLLFLISFPLMAANFVLMAADMPRRPLTRTNLLVTLGALLAIPAWVWWSFSHRTPESESRARSLLDSFSHFISHPAVAVPLWLGFVYLLYRRWRLKPPPTGALPHVQE